MNYLFNKATAAIEFAQKRKYILILCGLAGLVSWLYSPQLTVVLASLPIVYFAMSSALTSKIFSSKALIAVVTLISYVAILQMSFFIGWLVFKEITLYGSSVIAFILSAILLILVGKNELLTRRPLFTRVDVVALVATVLFCVPFFGIPLMKAQSEQNRAPALTLINTAFDDSSHLGMLNDRIQFNRGVLAETQEAKNSRYDGVIYPAGWHSANAVFANALFPKIEPGIQTAVYYAINKSVWFAILCFVFVRMAGIILEIHKRKPSSLALTTLAFAGIAIISIFFVDTYITGFYSFLPVIITTCLLIPGLFEIYRAKNPPETIKSLILPGFLVSLSTLSWLLVLPMYGLAVLFIGFERARHIFSPRGWSKRIIALLVFVASIVGISTIAQVKVSSSADGAVSFIQGILIPGGIITYSPGFYIVCIAFLAIFFILVKRKYAVPALLYLAGIVLFVAFIYVVQQYKNQSNSYYFYKSLAVFTSAAFVMGAAGLTLLADKLELKSRIASIAIGVSVPLVLVMTLIPNPTIFAFINGERAASPGVSNQIYNELSTNYDLDNYYDKQVTLLYPANSPVLNEVGSMMLKVNRAFNSCWTVLKIDSFNTKSTEFNAEVLKNPDCADFKVKYYVDKQDLDQFKEKIRVANLSDKATVEVLDTDNSLLNSEHQ